MKYGIMLYKETDNIGDDIQTYTAKRFLPHIDYYIDREDLNCFVPNEKEYVSVIMNGWFMHNKSAWPPTPYINPLLISMHFTCLEKVDVGEKYLQGLGGEYLKQHQPIGCRDEETGKRLTRNGIENYFTGCMTLTLQKFENIQKQDYICLVDLDEASSNIIKNNTTREIKEITHTLNPEETKNKTFEERMNAVEDLLKTYQGANLVLTNRLHVALPCLALGTPVILIHKEKFEYDRLGTYLKYMTSFTETEFANANVKELIENPAKNSEEFLEIRNNLIKQCEEFITKCENEDLNIDNLPDIEQYKKYTNRLKWYQQLNEDIRVKAKNNIYESEARYLEYENRIKQNYKEIEEWKSKYEALEKEHCDLEKEYNNVKEEANQSKKELTSVYKSKGWKLLEKIRKIKGKKA